MKDTFKYKFRFLEINSRLGSKKIRTKTLELSRDLFVQYNVSGMLKAFMNEKERFTCPDSNVVVKSITIGRTIFQI